MRFNKNELVYLTSLVRKDLEHVRKDKKAVLETDVSFLKAEHELEHFLADLVNKLGGKNGRSAE